MSTFRLVALLFGKRRTEEQAQQTDPRQEKIDALLANVKSLTEDDRKWLTDLSDKEFMLVENELSFDGIRSLLWDFVNALDGPEYINFLEEVYPDHFIYSVQERNGSERTLYKRSYTITKEGEVDTVSVTDDTQEVVRRTEYIPVDTTTANSTLNKETDSMNKEAIVAALIACDRTPYAEEDRQWLMGMSECQLNKLSAENYKPAQTTINNTSTITLEDLPEPLQKQFRGLMAREEATKKSLVAKVIANKACKFTEAELLARDLDEIEKIAGLIGVEEKPTSYLGQVGFESSTEGAKVPPMPSTSPAKK